MRRVIVTILLVAAFAAALCPPAVALCCLRGEFAGCRDDDCGPPADCCRELPAPDVAQVADHGPLDPGAPVLLAAAPVMPARLPAPPVVIARALRDRYAPSPPRAVDLGALRI